MIEENKATLHVSTSIPFINSFIQTIFRECKTQRQLANLETCSHTIGFCQWHDLCFD